MDFHLHSVRIQLLVTAVLCTSIITMKGESGVSVSVPNDREPNDLSRDPLATPEKHPRDCREIQERTSPKPLSGVYPIYPLGYTSPLLVLVVYCDFETEGGGWTVIQRRMDGSVDFNRGWDDYKRGFGNLESEFWLGNEHISTITALKRYQLRLELTGRVGGPQYYAKYSYFGLAPEKDLYKLHVSSYSGNVGTDSLGAHHNMFFSTKDADNDADPSRHCSTEDPRGGWWFNACKHSALNGLYPDYLTWAGHPSGSNQMRFTEMKIRAV